MKKIKELSFVDKTYLYAVITLLVVLVSIFFVSNFILVIGVLITLVVFTFSLLNDVVETTKPILKYKVIKGILVVSGSILSTFSLIETYQDVNEVIGVDPSLLPFTTSLMFVVKTLSLCSFYFGLGFMVLIILSSAFFPLLLVPSNKKDDTTAKTSKLKWIVRFMALFSVYVLGNVLAPDRPEMKLASSKVIYNLAFYADFNSYHHCKNAELDGESVLFLQKGFVLAKNKSNEFEIFKCY